MSLFRFGNLSIGDLERYVRGLEPWLGGAVAVPLEREARGGDSDGTDIPGESPAWIVNFDRSSPAKQTEQ